MYVLQLDILSNFYLFSALLLDKNLESCNIKDFLQAFYCVVQYTYLLFFFYYFQEQSLVQRNIVHLVVFVKVLPMTILCVNIVASPSVS